jgi:hypothetical protein
VGELEGRSLVVATNRDGWVEVWELLGGTVVRERLLAPRHAAERELSTLAVGGEDSRPLVIIGDRDGDVQISDPTAALSLTFNIGSAVVETTIIPPSTVVVGASMGLAVIDLANNFPPISLSSRSGTPE